MNQLLMIVSGSFILRFFIVMASFWAFIVCGGFVISTLLPIVNII